MDCNNQIIELIKHRMEKGRKQYGHGILQDAGYEWVREALEEALDLSVYISAKLIQVERANAQRFFGDLTEDEINEWVMKRLKKCTDETQHKGETIEID